MGIHLKDAKIPKGERVYAIGDVHGCLLQLTQLLKAIKRDLKSSPVEKYHIVFLGDYVDRGPDSKGVIDRLIKLQRKHANVHLLKGNHEEKLLDFLDHPEKLARGFFTYGGVETALSYGVKSGHLDVAMPNARKIRSRLLDRIPENHMKFFQNLAVSVSIGDFFFCHAGIRPGVKLKKQRDHDLMWIRQEFIASSKLHEKIVVHGHTPRMKPVVRPNRINVDTKCYASGVLSCLVLEKCKRRFIQTGKQA